MKMTFEATFSLQLQ